jgi:adenosylmethionine-8-amino-7-oxononanoate aminotransferase
MGNALACAVALASIELLLSSDFRARVAAISAQLAQQLAPCRALPQVADVRVLGAIGVVELNEPVDMSRMVPALVERGVWLRPFGRLVYTMPPFVIAPEELSSITRAICEVVAQA